VLSQTQKHRGKFRWKAIASIDHLREIRMEAMQRFLNDFADSDSNSR